MDRRLMVPGHSYEFEGQLSWGGDGPSLLQMMLPSLYQEDGQQEFPEEYDD